jgi:fimbrial isopeptide formation D2 family protein/uncharacterized repeat protein (TIGR01451 family)
LDKKGGKKLKRKNMLSILIAVIMIVSTVTVTSDDPAGYGLKVTKAAWDGSSWDVDGIDADMGETIRFNITITYIGTGDPHGIYAKNVKVVDTLPDGLEYVGNEHYGETNPDADIDPQQKIEGNKITWYYNVTYLEKGESYYIEFDAKVIDYGTHVNHVDVTALEVCSQENMWGCAEVTVRVPGPPPGDMICDKKVWDSDSQSWKDEIDAKVGDKVRFNITITYRGSLTLEDIRVKDILPSCLAYADNAVPPETGISGNVIFWNLSVTLQNGESTYIEFDADVVSTGVNVNLVNVTAKEDCNTLYCEATATVRVIVEPGNMICEKKVLCGSDWVEKINAKVGDKVRFNITITYRGSLTLEDIRVKDILPSCLAYADNAVPPETGISGNVIFWNLSVTLQNGESTYIEFDADVVSTGVNVNLVNVTAKEDCNTLYCEDTATVIVEEGKIICEKQVWDGCKWVEEITATVGDTVRFNLTVTYQGNYSLYNIRVKDILPSCLRYADNATPPENGTSDKVIFWNLTDILYNGDSTYIEFDADVISPGVNVNLMNVTAEECSGKTFYCEDTATVYAEEPPTNITCEKKVWDICKGWVEEITAKIGDTVRFNLTLTYTGSSYTLYNIRVIDTLPPCLEYANDANPPESGISGNKIFWNFTDPEDALQPGEKLHIYFYARVVTPGVNVNVMNVTANECSGKIFKCSDTATVNVPGPDLECDKRVWDKAKSSWVEEISAEVGEKVRFNITVTYLGTKSTYHVRILDTLPFCLEYAYNAEPTETAVNKSKVLWDLMITLKPGESTYVEFDALVISEGVNVNVANVSVNECGDGKVLKCSDTATVNATKPAEPLEARITGPSSGYVDETLSFKGSATGGVPPYEFAWDLDNDGDYDDATGPDASKSWSTPGKYKISLKVTDKIGQTDTASKTITISRKNTPPRTPERPQGETEGRRGKDYTYSTKTTDPEGDQVWYQWDWGDGNFSDWIGPFSSGETASATHNWSKKGTYNVRVKARDKDGAQSGWSEPLVVSIPKYRTPLFIQILERLMERFPLLERLLSPLFRLLNL